MIKMDYNTHILKTLIDWTEFYAVSATFQPYNSNQKIGCEIFSAMGTCCIDYDRCTNFHWLILSLEKIMARGHQNMP